MELSAAASHSLKEPAPPKTTAPALPPVAANMPTARAAANAARGRPHALVPAGANEARERPPFAPAGPPLARASMVARPWQAQPLRAWLHRKLRPAPSLPNAEGPRGDATEQPWQRSARRRRLALVWLVALPTLLATQTFAHSLPDVREQWLAGVQLTLFAVLFAWIAAGFWTGVMGFFVLARGGDPAGISAAAVRGRPLDPRARTAIVMPICNEHVPTVFAGLRSTCESLAATGALSLFDIYLLSDTSDPALRAAEVDAWRALVDALGGEGRIFYRWRARRTRRKAGNVADFCRRWGRNYRYMVVLDADSVMSGESLTTLVRLMEAHPDAGIIQTVPAAVGRDTLHARLQQFVARTTGRLFAVGMQFWQLGESHYWGHNAIIRVAPFMQHCALARLPGRGPLAGDVMSHDFVEAALMRRAGYHVWLVHDLGGSYEQVPPNFLAELQRDRRWCHGNLQNLRLILEPGLHPVHRAMLATGAFSYLAAPLWLVFTLLATLGVLDAGPLAAAAFQDAHSSLLVLLLTMAALLVVPKVLAIVHLFLRGEQKRFGGGTRLVGSACVEMALSMLYAPVRMAFHSAFVLSILAGRHGGWRSPPRDDAGTPWREALRRHAPHAAYALLWLALVLDGETGRAWWLLPLMAGLLLAPLLSVLSSRAELGRWLRTRGLFLIPEEAWTPQVLRQVRRHLLRLGWRTQAA